MNPGALEDTAVVNSDIEHVLSLREARANLKKKLEMVDTAIEDAEQAIMTAIENGADLSHCQYTVDVKEVTKRYPAWRDHLIQHLGKAKADQILEETEPKVYRNLVIKDAA